MPAETIHDVIILQCDRLSFGPFERGPIHLLLEGHNKAKVPTKCLDYEPAAVRASILRGIWFDDPEIAAYFAANWSMTVHVGTFDYQDKTEEGVSVRKWIWKEGTGQSSEIDYSRTETSEGGNPHAQLFFWHDGISVFGLDLIADDKQPLVTPYTNAGHLQPPMMPIDPYVGVFSLVDPGATYTGSFHHFRDLKCNDS